MEYPLTRSVEVITTASFRKPRYEIVETGGNVVHAEFSSRAVAEYVADLMNRAFYGAHAGSHGGICDEKPNA